MKIAVMTVNDFGFHPNRRFREEAEKGGHELVLINPYTMGCRVASRGMGMFFSGEGGPPDLVMPRQGSPMGEYGFVLLYQFAAMGIPLVNGIQGVRVARNQFMTLQRLASAGLPVPESCFAVSRENVFRAVSYLKGYPVVVKQMDGMGGEGVAKLNDRPETDAYLDRYFNPRKGLLVQSYIPSDGRKDFRILVVGGRVAGAMMLTPAQGGFKSNVHQQGRAEAWDPDPESARMAVEAAQICSLEVAGVDMMRDAQGRGMISEVNYSPGFRGLEEATGQNIAGAILGYALEQATEKGKTR